MVDCSKAQRSLGRRPVSRGRNETGPRKPRIRCPSLGSFQVALQAANACIRKVEPLLFGQMANRLVVTAVPGHGRPRTTEASGVRSPYGRPAVVGAAGIGSRSRVDGGTFTGFERICGIAFRSLNLVHGGDGRLGPCRLLRGRSVCRSLRGRSSVGREAIYMILSYSNPPFTIHQSRNCKGRKITANFGCARNQSASRRSYRRDVSM